MRNVFLRAQQMMAEISGVKVVCRGVVHCLKEDKTALQAETETFGGAMKPLYVYFGDGKVLCGAENARLTAGGETRCKFIMYIMPSIWEPSRMFTVQLSFR